MSSKAASTAKETETAPVVQLERAEAPALGKFLGGRLGLTPTGLVVILVMIALPFIPPFNQQHLLRWLIGAAFIAAQSIAFDFTTGYINVVNFGFAAFLGVGAYTSALLAVNFGLTPWIGMLAGGVVAAALGLVTGLLTLRVRGIFAALMSWFVGLALLGLARNLVDLTRGPAGLRSPFLLDTSDNLPYYFIILVMTGVVYVVTRLITSSHIGLAFKAIGQNVDAARASGLNPTFYKVFNFTIQCALAGWLGGFYAHYIGILTPNVMLTAATVQVLAIAYIGGRGSLWGGAVAAFPFIFWFEWMRSSLTDLPGLHLVIYGAMLIIVMIFYPGGLAKAVEEIGEWIKNQRTQPAEVGAD